MENYCIFASTGESFDANPFMLMVTRSAALLCFDHASTFTSEVERIWKRRHTGATIVYLFTRYLVLIERVFFVLQVLMWNASDLVGAQ